jgi:hypothetical protein
LTDQRSGPEQGKNSAHAFVKLRPVSRIKTDDPMEALVTGVDQSDHRQIKFQQESELDLFRNQLTIGVEIKFQ